MAAGEQSPVIFAIFDPICLGGTHGFVGQLLQIVLILKKGIHQFSVKQDFVKVQI